MGKTLTPSIGRAPQDFRVAPQAAGRTDQPRRHKKAPPERGRENDGRGYLFS